MKILEKYILRENFMPFLGSVTVITFLMLLDKIMDIMDKIMASGVGTVTVLKVFGLSLPFLLAMSVPMSVLMASIMSFGRLAVDGELTAFKACGINIYRLVKPTLAVALLLSLFMVYFNNRVLPETNYKLMKLYYQIGLYKPSAAIKPGTFTEIDNTQIYVKEKKNDILHGVLINQKQSRKNSQTITALTGELHLANGGNGLQAVLYNGQMYEQDKANPKKYQLRYFKKFIINKNNLGEEMLPAGNIPRTDRTMTDVQIQDEVILKMRQELITSAELVKTELDIKKLSVQDTLSEANQKKYRNANAKKRQYEHRMEFLRQEQRELMVEWHKKFSLAAVCFIFAFVGIPIGMMTRTSGVGMAFTVSSVVYILYYMMLIGGEDLANRGYISPFLSMWMVNIILGILGIYLNIISAREERFINLSFLKNIGAWLLKKFAKVEM